MSNRNVALTGLFKMMLSVILSRAGSLITQVVAAWYLIPEQFGLYASVYSVAAIAMSVKNGSFLSLMLHKEPNEKIELRNIAIVINILLFLVLCLLSLMHSNETASILMMIFSLVVLFSVFGLDLRLEFSVNNDFFKLANLEVYSSIIQQIVSILCLIIGFGVFSLAIGFAAVTLFEFVYKYRLIGFCNEKISLKMSVFHKYFSECKWLIASAIVMGVALQGDYFALSITTSFYILGIYFFAFQLTSAASQLITSAIRSVMVPTLINYKSNTPKLNEEFNFYSNLVFVWSIIFVFSGIVLSNFLIDLVWSGKWSMAIPVVNALLLSLIARFQLPLLYSYFEVAEAWRFKFSILALDAALLLFVAFIAGLSSDLYVISLSIAAYRILSSLFFLLLASKYIKGFPISVFYKACITCAFTVPLYAIYLWIGNFSFSSLFHVITNIFIVIAAVLISLLLFKKESMYFSDLVFKKINKRF